MLEKQIKTIINHKHNAKGRARINYFWDIETSSNLYTPNSYAATPKYVAPKCSVIVSSRLRICHNHSDKKTYDI